MKFLFTLLVAGIIIITAACNTQQQRRQAEFQQWLEPNGKIKVLSTTGMINDLVKEVGGEYVDALVLIQGDLDPHSYQLVKGDDERLNAAEIIFYNGLGLEHGPSLQKYLQDSRMAIGLGNYFDPESIIIVDGQKDPHVWMDISLWAKALPVIVDALSHKNPDHADTFEVNAKKYAQQMQIAHKEVADIMHAIPEQKRYLVTSHDAFNYFTRAYLSEPEEVANGQWVKRFAAPEGLSPDSQLGTQDIKFIVDHVKKYGIAKLYPETNVSRDSIRKIIDAAKEQGIELSIADCCPLYGDAMGPPGSEGDTYLKMIKYNANKIASEMK